MLVLVFATLISVVNSIPVDNGVAGEPEIECGPTSILISFNTINEFEGSVYVKGLFAEDECRTEDRGRATTSIELPFSACNTRRERSLNPKGVFVSTTVFITFHPKFLTKVDRAYRIQCFYMEADKTVSTDLEVSMLTPDTRTQNVPMPVCRYEIYDVVNGSPTDTVIEFAEVGQPVYHKWTCDTETEDTFCMIVHSCFVDDTNGDQTQLIAEDGCAVDRYLLNNPEYTANLMAGVEAHVFKFADRANLYFECQITILIKEVDLPCPQPACPVPAGRGAGGSNPSVGPASRPQVPWPLEPGSPYEELGERVGGNLENRAGVLRVNSESRINSPRVRLPQSRSTQFRRRSSTSRRTTRRSTRRPITRRPVVRRTTRRRVTQRPTRRPTTRRRTPRRFTQRQTTQRPRTQRPSPRRTPAARSFFRELPRVTVPRRFSQRVRSTQAPATTRALPVNPGPIRSSLFEDPEPAPFGIEFVRATGFATIPPSRSEPAPQAHANPISVEEVPAQWNPFQLSEVAQFTIGAPDNSQVRIEEQTRLPVTLIPSIPNAEEPKMVPIADLLSGGTHSSENLSTNQQTTSSTTPEVLTPPAFVSSIEKEDDEETDPNDNFDWFFTFENDKLEPFDLASRGDGDRSFRSKFHRGAVNRRAKRAAFDPKSSLNSAGTVDVSKSMNILDIDVTERLNDKRRQQMISKQEIPEKDFYCVSPTSVILFCGFLIFIFATLVIVIAKCVRPQFFS